MFITNIHVTHYRQTCTTWMYLSWSRDLVKYSPFSSKFHIASNHPLSSLFRSQFWSSTKIKNSWLSEDLVTDFGLVHIFEITERTIIVKTQTYYNLVENKPMNWIVTSLLSPWNRCETSRTHVIERAETTWLDFISTVDLKSLILFAREN